MEGRTHKVDNSLLAPILLHAASHIVRVRCYEHVTAR